MASDAAADILAGASDDDDGAEPYYMLTLTADSMIVAMARALVAKRKAQRRCSREAQARTTLLRRGNTHTNDVCSICIAKLGVGSMVFKPAGCEHRLHAVCYAKLAKSDMYQDCPSCRKLMFGADHLLDTSNELAADEYDDDDDDDESV